MTTPTSISTIKFRKNNAFQFLESIDEIDPSRVYISLGKTTPWEDDENPPQPNETIKNGNKIWDDIISFKKITSSGISLLAPRYFWESGVDIYKEYSDNSPTLWDDKYYTFTDEYNVYKCIYNNKNSISTVKPTGNSVNNIQTTDGYIWKYLFTVSQEDSIKFLSAYNIPVKKIEEEIIDPIQWSVQETSIDRSIENIKILNSGGFYESITGGTILASVSTIKFEISNSSIISNYYNDYSVTILSGTGIGQIRKISQYDGDTNVATLSTQWDIIPDTSSVYYVSPTVVVIGENISPWKGYSVVEDSSIGKVVTINGGKGYISAEAHLLDNHGTGVLMEPIISPINGHGNDCTKELPSNFVGLYIVFSGDENGDALVDNDFRQLSIILNPKETNGNFADNLTYSMNIKINIINTTGLFINDETIVGNDSGASGVIVFSDTNNVEISNVKGNFNTSDVITGSITDTIAEIESIITPEIEKYSGDILFVKNIQPITRSVGEDTHIKMIVPF